MKCRLLFILNGSILLLCGAPAQAQSLWNNAGTSNWFTPGNWTPSGAPDTNIKAQINNGGTAQIAATGAAANTLILGNATGESGTLNISGAGQLTINAATGFFITVGESGTGTLNVSAGGAILSAPVFTIGNMAGSVGTVTVTGVGSAILSQFQLEVGRSGTGTLNLFDGATVTAQGAFDVGNGTGAGHLNVDGTTANLTTLNLSSVNIGGTTLGGTGDVTVTGTNAKLNATAGLDVGSAGTGTLTMSAGAKGNATALLIGDDGTGTVTLTDTGTALTLTGFTAKVTVGNTTTANLNIQAGATLTSLNGVVGQTPGSVGTVTITGTGSTWTIGATNGFLTGRSSQPGGTAAINVLNGGKLSAQNLSAYTDTTIKVDGVGSQLSLPNDSGAAINKSLFLGSVGTNKLDVTNGGTLTTGATILTTTAGSSLVVNVSGTGSNWTLTPLVGTPTTQFGGAGAATFTVSNGGSFTYTQDGFFNVDATGAGTASLTVSSGGTFTVKTTAVNSGILRIGQDGTGSLMIDSGGIVNTGHTYVGEDTGAVGTVTATGVGTIWNASDLQVGTIGGHGTVTVSGGATLNGDAVIGGSAANPTGTGQMTVTGSGTTWIISPTPTNNFVFVEKNGSLSILAGATVTGNLTAGTGGFNGTILIDGIGTHVNGGSLSSDGTGSITIQNQAVVSGTSTGLGQNEGANSLVTVDGVGTQWNMTGNAFMGSNGTVTVNIQNGAHVSSNQLYLGYDKNADNTGGNGIVNVTGTGSSLAANSFLRVADYFFTGGTLTISQGGTVTSVSGGTAGTASGLASTNNATGTIVVTGAGSSWTNTGDIYVGNSGTTGVGTLTVASSGAVSVTGATSINATSTLNIGNGATAGTFSSASVANSGLIHFNLTDSVNYSAPTSGTGTVVKDGAGTVTILGTHTYTGTTTINDGLFVVNGTLGNTAVTVNNGGRLGGSGAIAGPVTIANGGTLAPGNSPGTITVGTLTLNSGSIENYELATPNVVGGGVNDLTIVNGNLTLDGTLNVAGLGGFGAGVYRLFNFTGTLTDDGLSLGTLPAGFTYTVDTGTANQINLDVVALAALSYWNGSHTTPNGAVNGGTGTWDNTTTNWTEGTGVTSGPWAGTMGIFAGSAGTATLGANISFTGLQFSTDGYTINQDAGHAFTLIPTGPATVTVDPGLTATIAAPITGSGGLTKSGTGVLILSGTNTYNGATAVQAGHLQLFHGSGGSFGFASNVTVSAGAFLDLNQITGFTGTFSNNVTNDGTVEAINGGGGGTILDTGTITGGGQLVVGLNGATTVAGAALILANTNSYSGGTRITGAGSTLQVGNGGTAGSVGSADVVVDNGGTLGITRVPGNTFSNNVTNGIGGTGFANFGSGFGVASLTVSGTVTDGAAGNVSVTVGTNFGGPVIFTNPGNTYSGITSIFSGALQIGTAGQAGSMGSGSVFLDGGATLTIANIGGPVANTLSNNVRGPDSFGTGSVTVNSSNTNTLSGNFIDGSAAKLTFAQGGPGTTILTGTSTYTGATTINGGLLRVDGSLGATSVAVNNGGTLGGIGIITGAVTVNSGGILAPGDSPGTITVGPLTLNAGSIENYELGTPNVVGGATNDLTIVNGAFTLDGTLNVTNEVGFGVGVYRLFTYTGALTNNILDLGTLPGGFNYVIDTSIANQVNLDVSAVGATFTYWNGAHTTPNGTVNGGTGTWNTTTTNWTDVNGNSSGAWANGSVAHFTGASGTVTLGANITATEIQFLAGSGAYTITAAPNTSLTVDGVGITNNSGIAQHFVADSSAAGNGQVIFNLGAVAGDSNTDYTAIGNSTVNGTGGRIILNNNSKAGTATFTNTSGAAGPNTAGSTSFHDNASADHGTFNNNGGTASGVGGGRTDFFDTSHASAAHLTNNGGTAASAGGGTTVFHLGTSAENSVITNNTGTVAGTSLNRTGAGTTVFQDTATAGSATITNNPVSVLDSDAGATFFHDNATAATSHITNSGGTLFNFLNGGGGLTQFFDTATAGSASISNSAGTLIGVGGGTTVFANSSQAGTATITNDGGTLAGGQGGVTFLDNTATAGTATFINQGAVVASARGGRTAFLGTSTAADATLVANGGSGGGPGGEVEFFDDSTGGTAAVQLFGNGQLDISGHNASGVAIGSLEGSGLAFLGARNLTVGSTNVDKLFSGVIQDNGFSGGTGGSFTKVGTALLNLTGSNTYTGATTVNGGTLAVNGSLAAASQVTVNSTATLAGTGTVGGSVTLSGGGILSPGNNGVGTLTTGALTASSGSQFNYELAAPSSAHDLTEVTGNLTLGGAALNITGLPGFGIGTYRILDYTGTLLGSTLNIGTAPLGYLYTVDTSIAQQVNLDVAGGGPLPIAYFNGSHLAPNGVVNGGSGVWDNTTTNWTDETGNVFGTWGGGIGFFSGRPGTVDVGSNVDFTGLEFVTNGYVINGHGFLLNGVGPVTILTDPNVVATINAAISAPGGLTKLGTGSLFLNGSLFGNLQLLQGLMGGNFSVFGNLFNAATLSPGHSPGAVHVSGNYTQAPTGLLRIDIGGREISQHDLLSVGGVADLDGTLQLLRLNHFKLKRHKPVTFLTAAGGVRGEFDNVISDFTSDTILQPTVIYRANSVALEAVQGLFASLDGLTVNQKSVARALDSAANDRRANSLFDYLDYRKLSEIPKDLDKIAPEELTSVFTIGVSLANVQSGNIQRRTDDIRSGSGGFNAAGLAVNGTGPSYSGSFRTGVAGPNGAEIRGGGKEVKETKAVVPAEDRWGAFLSGTGEWVSVGNTDNARGYDLTSGGFTLGIDYKVTPNFAIGLAAGYTGTTADLVDRGRVYVNGGKIGLYATFFQNEQAAAPTMSKDSKELVPARPSIAKGFYADMAVFGGYNSYDTRRSALQGEARGDTDGGELNALFGMGYDIKKGGLTFGPTASFNYTYLGTNDFTEHGSLAPLNVHGGKGESLRSAFGLKASYDWKVGGILIKPEIRAAWQHEYGDSAYELGSNFANGAGNSFTVAGPQLGRDSVLLGAGFAIQFNERMSTYFYYDGELGRKNYQSTSVTGGFRVAF
ncbi:MAG: autotransporter-associated beta strand repeat-containing protein [Chthoniobacter sp.]|uniref:autotransporter-associated beta strand repeat-containing protein n=1 Tax=Chthoniobacter sp. TaxID=2510640 RepID=UPI0032A315E3